MPQCHLVQRQVPSITFTPKGMLLKDNKHDQLLYFTRYIGSTCIEGSMSIQDLLSASSFLGIPLSMLSTTITTIYGFNARSSHPLGKIHLWCQIGDLKSEVTCYVIDTDTSYNLLLRRPGFTPIGSSHPRCTSASNMWAMMLWFERCLLSIW